ncbi:hypothetical protein GCM10020229_71840 [Kitasatospora albolonga]
MFRARSRADRPGSSESRRGAHGAGVRCTLIMDSSHPCRTAGCRSVVVRTGRHWRIASPGTVAYRAAADQSTVCHLPKRTGTPGE